GLAKPRITRITRMGLSFFSCVSCVSCVSCDSWLLLSFVAEIQLPDSDGESFMDAVVLAAGLGTRLRPHTLQTPKPLLPVQGRPILDWALGALPPVIDRVVVVVHYLADQVETYLREQKHVGQWATVFQDKPQGTGDALRMCRDHLSSDRFLVVNGDDLYGAADLAALSGCAAGLLVQMVNEPRLFGIAFLKPNGPLDRLV